MTSARIREGRRTRGRRLALLLLAIVVSGAAPAHAWNDEGHMAVAYLAYQRLSPTARKRADSLLKLNPYYPKWRAAIPSGTPADETSRMIFMIAATWPDQIRSDPDYHDDGSNGGNTPDGPKATQNIGYQDHLRHKYWHFINIPFSQDGSQLPAVPSPNIQTQIAAFRTTLDGSESDDVKSYDLTWLEHLVGDVHMPLHAAARVSASMPDGDAGGNRVLLCSAPCNESLHLFWDRLVGSQSTGQSPPPRALDLIGEVESATRAAKALPLPGARLAAVTDEAVWVRESFDDAKKYVYAPPIGPGAGPYTITPGYFEAARAVARERVALAGARLAKLLNSHLK